MKRFMYILLLVAVAFVISPLAFADDFDLPNDADMDFYGTQQGENLGFSVILGDLNADGVDDIIVGAPGHSDYVEPIPQGRVYITWGGQDDSVDLTIRTSGDFYWPW